MTTCAITAASFCPWHTKHGGTILNYHQGSSTQRKMTTCAITAALFFSRHAEHRGTILNYHQGSSTQPETSLFFCRCFTFCSSSLITFILNYHQGSSTQPDTTQKCITCAIKAASFYPRHAEHGRTILNYHQESSTQRKITTCAITAASFHPRHAEHGGRAAHTRPKPGQHSTFRARWLFVRGS